MSRDTNRIDAAVQTVYAPGGWAMAVEHRGQHRYIKGAEASVVGRVESMRGGKGCVSENVVPCSSPRRFA
jgi:hypothetical protein